jgi:AcrR family transcriptional regulator
MSSNSGLGEDKRFFYYASRGDTVVYRRTPKTELQKLERRTRILREARASIARAGFGGSKMKEIAERAGLSEGAIYRYFPTVTDLFVEVFREVALRELEVARQATSVPGPAGKRLEEAIRNHVERALRRPRLAYAMLAEPLAPELEATRLIYRKSFHELFAGVMEEAVSRGEYRPFDTATAAACMIGAFDEALIWPLAFRTGHGNAPQKRIEFVVGFCTSGIAPWKRANEVTTTGRRARGLRG